MASFIIDCYHLHICIYIHTFILPNITCSGHIILLVHMFYDLLLTLDKQLVSSSLGKTTSPPSFPQWLLVVCIGLRSCGLFSIQFDMFLGVFLSQFMFVQSCWKDFKSVSSDNTRRHHLTADSLTLWPY